MPGRTVANGYGKEHKRLRAHYATRMRMGEVFWCWRCGHLISPEAPWDLGHDDADRSLYRGPEHVSCNRSETRKRAQRARPRRRGSVAPWIL
jgi:hypothetical protein